MDRWPVARLDAEDLLDVTLAVELDDRPEDVGWVFEEDPGTAARTASAGRTAHIAGGPTQVPFDTYAGEAAGRVVAQALRVAPNEQVRVRGRAEEREGGAEFSVVFVPLVPGKCGFTSLTDPSQEGTEGKNFSDLL